MDKTLLYLLIIFIGAFLLYIYHKSNKEYDQELIRIREIENRIRMRENKIQKARDRTIECNIPNLNSPRECYFKSNYECRWDEDADRCNQYY
jgi:hypothetical protein